MNPFHHTHSLVILSKEYYSFLQPNIYTWHIGLLDGSAWKATHFIFIALVTVKRPARVFPRLGRLQEEPDSMVSGGFERHHMVGSLIETKSCFQQPFSWSMSSANFVSGGRFITGYSIREQVVLGNHLSLLTEIFALFPTLHFAPCAMSPLLQA